MSQLPYPIKDIAQAPKQPKYKVLPSHCARPDCNKQAAHEHHTVGRWFTRSWEERDWALLGGTLVPIKVPLCHWDHDRVTRNLAKVSWNGKFFVWVDTDGEVELNYKPPLAVAVGVSPGVSPPDSDSNSEPGLPPTGEKTGGTGRTTIHALRLDTSEGDREVDPESPPHGSMAVVDEATPSDVLPGETCPTCKRRVNHKRNSRSPVSKVVSFRMPRDVAESYEEVIEAAARHLGVYERPFWKYTVVNAGLVYALQGPRNALKRDDP
jgi:hypothetical protein